jgi:signal transduction histidine kinase
MDVTLVRLTFAVLSFASGAGIVAYLGAWALLPAPGEAPPPRRRRIAGTVLLVWSVILALRGLGLSDSLVWPLALIGAGAALATGATTLGLDERRARITAIVLTVVGIAVFVTSSRHGSASTLLAPGAVAAALILLLGPWAWRLGRERDAERAERIRTQERADFAARVHDSVLQTLALIQRHPDDARRVATLARRQERELRTWLYPDREPAAAGTLADAVETAAAEVEELHGVRVEVVRTGDVPLDDRTRVLVLAAREAMTNAAKHSGADEISVFLDAAPGRVALYVRDRGAGFDPEAVAADRKGISESIQGRMKRMGGTATVVSAPGEGTDVELELA